MALWAAVLGVSVVGFGAIVADIGWAEPTRTPTAPATTVMPTGSSATRSAPITSPTTTPSGKLSPEPSATPSESPSPSVSEDPTPSKSSKGQPSKRYGPAEDRAPVGRNQGSRVVPASPTEAAAVPPRSSAPYGQGGEIEVETRNLSRVVAQGLIVGGAAGFVVSVAGMMLVGWIRRRV